MVKREALSEHRQEQGSEEILIWYELQRRTVKEEADFGGERSCSGDFSKNIGK